MAKKTGRPLPRMWVEKSLSCRMEGNFNHQHYHLSKLMPDQETVSIFISIASFRELIDSFPKSQFAYLQAFIGAYDDSDTIRAENKNKLMLMFCYSRSQSDGPPPYYSINTDGFFYADTDAEIWIKNYRDNKMPVLIPNLDPLANENYSGHPSVFSDTKRIHWEADYIYELFAEIDYQKEHNNTEVIGLRAFFSAYCHTGKPGSITTEYVNRVLVIFELLKLGKHGEEVVFYLDDQPDFKGRHPSGTVDAVDNGHLCPPNCP